ncbi:trans isomerase E [Seminavis robusta]|uniref:Trans isomerase E n=1 Tax=Seminavis robusta TaxID=568900 RepID=A0A9N8DHW6_9STRA|nr:trans isomerase E [Seminavis robusta]|eukprot:Sro161_g072480.1 trans isomerase E (126) ;mRNA; f:46413-46953
MTDPSILNSKRVVYVGGLADEVTIPLLRACMIPFGPIHSIDMPMDYAKGTSKGFAFVEFEEAEDATEAIFNRNGANLMGRTLQASMAQANQANKLTEPVWNSDEWFQKNQAEQKEGETGNSNSKS